MATTFADRWGVPVQASSDKGVALLDEAIESLAALAGDPVATAEAASAADDQLVLSRIYQAYLALYGTTPEGLVLAGQFLDRLGQQGEPLAERETHHLDAARAWAAGHWEQATRALERALLAHPRDLLALKVAQDLYFFLGRRLDLRDVAARVLPAWPPGEPGWGYVQGIYAFGLEENAAYRDAETRARRALADNPRDVWSVHALAHVLEMEGRQRSGVDNWWHHALYLELGHLDQGVVLYDGPIRGQRSTEWLDIVDAAALLWRLSLAGVDVTSRARQLAADISPLVAPRGGTPIYLFNDWHAVMAFGLAGEHQRNQAIVAANQQLPAGTNRRAAERAGLDLLAGFSAFAAGDPARALDLMIDVRPRADAVGGSHAQRDIIDLTLIAAAAQSGQTSLVRALVTERATRKPSAEPAARALVAANTVAANTVAASIPEPSR